EPHPRSVISQSTGMARAAEEVSTEANRNAAQPEKGSRQDRPTISVDGRPRRTERHSSSVGSESRLAPPPRSEPVPEPPPVASRPQQDDAQKIKDRLGALRSVLADQGVVVADLQDAQRDAWSSISTRLRQGELDGLDGELDRLEEAVRQVRIDGPFVRRKLDR